MKKVQFLCLFLLIFSCQKAEKNLTKITGKNIKIDSTIKSSTEIDEIVAPYKAKLIGEMEKVLSYNPINLTKRSEGLQSTLGNLLADLSVEMGNPIYSEKSKKTIDFALFNNGGLRASIPAGNVTKENAFKLMPFDNEFVVVTLSGDKVEALFEYFIKNKKAHPLSKNINLTITDDTYQLKIEGKNFDKNKEYRVLTSDYLQSGGDGMNFFKNPIELIPLNYKVRDAVIDYLEKVDTLKTTIDKRVILK